MLRLPAPALSTIAALCKVASRVGTDWARTFLNLGATLLVQSLFDPVCYSYLKKTNFFSFSVSQLLKMTGNTVVLPHEVTNKKVVGSSPSTGLLEFTSSRVSLLGRISDIVIRKFSRNDSRRATCSTKLTG